MDMKSDRTKRVFHYFWRAVVIALVNLMIVMMLWNPGGAGPLS